MHSNTRPETVVDKNGVLTTRHKKVVSDSARKLPTTGKEKTITGAERLSETNDLQKNSFVLGTAIVQSRFPGAKTVTLLDDDNGSIILARVDGDVVENDIHTFAAGKALSDGVAKAGTYRLSANVDGDKALGKFNSSNLAGASMSSKFFASTELSEQETSALVSALRSELNEDELQFIADEVTTDGIAVGVAGSKNVSEGTLAQLAHHDSSVVRSWVAESTQNPTLVAEMMNDSAPIVRMSAASNHNARPEDLSRLYSDSEEMLVIKAVAKNPSSTDSLVMSIATESWSPHSISEAIKRVDIDRSDVIANSTSKSFMKDDAVKSATKSAAEFSKYKGGELPDAPAEKILSDDEARAVAWRIASRMDAPEFAKLDAGEDFSPQKIAEEASSLYTTGPSSRPYGLKWDADNYARSMIAWARTKQGR
jgi:hypothetical protein